MYRAQSDSLRLVLLVRGWKRRQKSTCRCRLLETWYLRWSTGNHNTFRTGIPSWRDYCRIRSVATQKPSWSVWYECHVICSVAWKMLLWQCCSGGKNNVSLPKILCFFCNSLFIRSERFIFRMIAKMEKYSTE